MSKIFLNVTEPRPYRWHDSKGSENFVESLLFVQLLTRNFKVKSSEIDRIRLEASRTNIRTVNWQVLLYV